MYYLCSENKDTDHLCSYCTADLHHCFLILIYEKIWFSHDMAYFLALISDFIDLALS